MNMLESMTGLKPRYPTPTKKRPSDKTLERWMCDTECKATDGCKVELDGVCPHGHASWPMYLGFV